MSIYRRMRVLRVQCTRDVLVLDFGIGVGTLMAVRVAVVGD